MSLLMSLLPASGEIVLEFPSPRFFLGSSLILDLTGLGGHTTNVSSRRHRSRDHGEY
jgi:hypothetical protein